MRHLRRSIVPGAAALAALAAFCLAAGCGGGGDHGGRVVTTPAGRTITVPTITLPSGATVNVAQLTPFRDCLRNHGVTPRPFGPAGQTGSAQSIIPTRAEMAARAACAGRLPPRLERLYERYRRRYARRIELYRRFQNRCLQEQHPTGLCEQFRRRFQPGAG